MAGKLVTIATFAEASHAHLARGALEAAGIPVSLNNEESFALFGDGMTALGGIRLVVREEDESAAVKVLDDTFGTEDSVSEEELTAQAVATVPDELEHSQVAPDDPSSESLDREKNARVAFRAAATSLLIPFVVIFAYAMIRRTASGPGELSARGRWNLNAAITLVIWPTLLLCFLALTTLIALVAYPLIRLGIM